MALPAETFSHVLESKALDFPLFAPPYEPIGDRGYAIGFHVARLVSDGGTLQIGIGQEGDAAAQSLILRQKDNAAFREVLAGPRVRDIRGLQPVEWRAGDR